MTISKLILIGPNHEIMSVLFKALLVEPENKWQVLKMWMKRF